MTLIDRAGGVRDGEMLDTAAVDRYMKTVLADLKGEPEIRQFPGGASNLTYQLAYSDRIFVLRRPPFGHIARSAHDMLREAKVMQALKPVYPYVPQIIAICDDHDVLGCDFYVMERLEGIILRQDFPAELELDESDTRKLCLNVIDRLVELHQVDYRAAGLEIGKGAGYVRRQIAGWSDRFRKARTEDVGDFEPVMDWLREHMPADSRLCVIHNDYRFDNVVLDETAPQKIIGVLDWEMATVGDPLMDLGNTLAYWVQADDPEESQLMRLMPTHLEGALTRRQLVQRYMAKTGRTADDFAFYSAFGLFRLAVIAQQIYYRYYHGQTKDERFKMLIFGVHVLEKAATRVMNEGFF